MDKGDLVTAALRMHPDRPGVGRLCQEVLAMVIGQPIQTPRVEMVKLRGHRQVKRRL